MIDLLTKITMALGNSQQDNNELYEAKKNENWKLNVVIEYATTHSKDKDIINKCVELAIDLGLTKSVTSDNYWKQKLESINKGLTKDKTAKEATKKVKKASHDYGCGSSISYGCGSSRSYGCGGSRSSSYGCGSSSSRSYGC